MPKTSENDAFAENAFDRTLDARLQTWRDVTPPANLKARIAVAVASGAVRSSPWNFLRRPVLAAVACAGALGVFYLWPGSLGQPAPAFADIERSMKSVNSLSFTSELEIKLRDGHYEHERTQEWMQRRPPIALSRRSIKCDLGKELRTATRTEAQGYAERDEKTGKWRVGRNRDDLALQIEQTLLVYTQAEKYNPVLRPGRDLMSPWQVQRTNLGEKTAWLFTRTFREINPKSGKQDATRATRVEIVRLWVDATTHLVLRSEVDRSWEKNGRKDTGEGYQNSIRTDFRYNAPPPPGLRDIHPPKEKTQPGTLHTG